MHVAVPCLFNESSMYVRQKSLLKNKINHLALLLLSVAFLFPEPANAFVRTKTCDRSGGFGSTKICRVDQEPLNIYWANPCITYYVNREGSSSFGGLSGELLDIVEASFKTWENVSCGSLQFALGGLTCNRNIGREDQNITGGNQNLIVWVEDNWEYSSDAIAITVVSPDPKTGEILDADIAMNGQHFNFANLASFNDTLADVQNTLTHEIGHLVGFNHENSIPEATMYPDAQPGELIKRDLHEDDIAGLCEVYPVTGAQGICQPSRIEDRTCTIEYGGELGCSTVMMGPAQDSSVAQQHIPKKHSTQPLRWLLAAGMLLLGITLRRRKRQR